jgi:hypothetical protein
VCVTRWASHCWSERKTHARITRPPEICPPTRYVRAAGTRWRLYGLKRLCYCHVQITIFVGKTGTGAAFLREIRSPLPLPIASIAPRFIHRVIIDDIEASLNNQPKNKNLRETGFC